MNETALEASMPGDNVTEFTGLIMIFIIGNFRAFGGESGGTRILVETLRHFSKTRRVLHW